MPSVLLCASGGVDSSVAGALLKGRGLKVQALFLKLTGTLQEERALQSAKEVFSQLDIPLLVRDKTRAFERQVIGYFQRQYLAGLTPNSCVICNPLVKIGTALKMAKEIGIDMVSTGHYARILKGRSRTFMLRATHLPKDQSYFLHQIPRRFLSRLVFPLGEMSKEQVRNLAKKLGIVDAVTDESQDICFFKGDYRAFLKDRIGKGLGPGPILTLEGRQIGTHKGLWQYTVGQRRGLGIPDATPYYVVEIRPGDNTLVVGKREDLFRSWALVEGVNWLVEPDSLGSLRCQVKIRSRHEAAPAMLQFLDNSRDKVRVCFQEPQAAITPGQFAVFYKADFVLGGGMICG